MTDTRKALEEARKAIDPFGFGHDCARRAMCRCKRCERFEHLLDAEAYLDAAMMLVPEGATFMVDQGPAHWIVTGEQKPSGRAEVLTLDPNYAGEGRSWKTHHGFAETPALALLAAILKAKEKDDEA